MSSTINTALVGKKWRENNVNNSIKNEENEAVDLFEVKKEKNINSDIQKY